MLIVLIDDVGFGASSVFGGPCRTPNFERLPDRGPLRIIDGEKDHTVTWAIAHAAYKRQRRNSAVTEIVKIPNRGHPHDRPRLAGGRPDGARLRQAVRLTED